jgi:hypothetical protein
VKDPKADLRYNLSRDEKKAVVQDLGYGFDMGRIQVATPAEVDQFFSPQADNKLSKKPISFHSTDTTAYTNHLAQEAAKQIATLMARKKRLEKGNKKTKTRTAKAQPKSKAFIESEDEESNTQMPSVKGKFMPCILTYMYAKVHKGAARRKSATFAENVKDPQPMEVSDEPHSSERHFFLMLVYTYTKIHKGAAERRSATPTENVEDPQPMELSDGPHLSERHFFLMLAYMYTKRILQLPKTRERQDKWRAAPPSLKMSRTRLQFMTKIRVRLLMKMGVNLLVKMRAKLL